MNFLVQGSREQAMRSMFSVMFFPVFLAFFEGIIVLSFEILDLIGLSGISQILVLVDTCKCLIVTMHAIIKTSG